MALGAGAGDQQDELDPALFGHFCRALVPGFLTEECQVDADVAARVGADILARAEAYAALDAQAQDVLAAPFAEEVAGYEPAGAPWSLKGAVSVIVRSSLLEDTHTHGGIEAASIKYLTTAAAAPLAHFLTSPRQHPAPAAGGPFAGLAGAYPRAWACLGAVAHACSADGGRWPYRAAAAPVPGLPDVTVEAPPAQSLADAVVLSGIDPRFDQEFTERMRRWAEADGGTVVLLASLSRISRHLGKLLRAVEYLLAHNAPILTANYLLRPHEVWVRRGPLALIDPRDPLPALRDSHGLSGAHRATAAAVVRHLDAGAGY